MNTYPVKTVELLEKHGHLIHPNHRASYKTLMGACPKGTLKSNWNYYQIRVPLVNIDQGLEPLSSSHRTVTKSTPKVLCEQLTREQWIALWDKAHTNPYQKIVNEYASKTIASMNQV